MANYGSVRHPLFSIGEGVGREKEERIKKQGLGKKKTKKTKPLPPPSYPISYDDIWMPTSIINSSKTTIIKPNNIMDKIWGNSKQRKNKIIGGI